MVIKVLRNFILNHDHVKESSCSKNCIKIKLDGGDEKVSVTKIYLHIPIKYLYDDMIKPPSLSGLDESIDNDGKFIIIDSKLHEFLPP